MRVLRGFVLCAAALFALGAGEAQAASLTITASPSSVPSGGGTVTVTEIGHADRDGQLIVYYQPASSACQTTSEIERNNQIGTHLNDRTNIGAGENFQETAQFNAAAGTSYRVCGYLSGYDDTVPPDVRADAPICAAGTHLSGNQCASSSQASTLAITASPSPIPAGGGTVSVVETGHARRDGQLIVYRQPASSSCQTTSEIERNNQIGTHLNDRTNIGAGEDFQETAQFNAIAGTSYRVCGYLAGYDDTVPPDVRADTLICTTGTHVSSNRCVSDSGGPSLRSALAIFAPSSAHGFFRVTLTWTATASDHNVFLYAQPARISCYRSSEDERNHGYRRIRTAYWKQFNNTGNFSKTIRLKESAGGRTRLCAYLYGFTDVGSPRKRASAVVG